MFMVDIFSGIVLPGYLLSDSEIQVLLSPRTFLESFSGSSALSWPVSKERVYEGLCCTFQKSGTLVAYLIPVVCQSQPMTALERAPY